MLPQALPSHSAVWLSWVKQISSFHTLVWYHFCLGAGLPCTESSENSYFKLQTLTVFSLVGKLGNALCKTWIDHLKSSEERERNWKQNMRCLIIWKKTFVFCISISIRIFETYIYTHILIYNISNLWTANNAWNKRNKNKYNFICCILSELEVYEIWNFLYWLFQLTTSCL